MLHCCKVNLILIGYQIMFHVIKKLKKKILTKYDLILKNIQLSNSTRRYQNMYSDSIEMEMRFNIIN